MSISVCSVAVVVSVGCGVSVAVLCGAGWDVTVCLYII